MDIDGDGITDNLLVAAPMFFSGGLEKGKVYIYRLTELVGKNWKTKTNRGKGTYKDSKQPAALNWVNTCWDSRHLHRFLTHLTGSVRVNKRQTSLDSSPTHGVQAFDR